MKDLEFLIQSADAIIECEQLLKWAQVVAYYGLKAFENGNVKFNLFEF